MFKLVIEMDQLEKKLDTIFCDIDGTVFKYRNFEDYTSSLAEPVEEVVSFLKEKKAEGAYIIMVTARPDYLYDHTVLELTTHQIPYDKIITGIGRGSRYLINDIDPKNGLKRAFAFNVERNTGIIVN